MSKYSGFEDAQQMRDVWKVIIFLYVVAAILIALASTTGAWGPAPSVGSCIAAVVGCVLAVVTLAVTGPAIRDTVKWRKNDRNRKTQESNPNTPGVPVSAYSLGTATPANTSGTRKDPSIELPRETGDTAIIAWRGVLVQTDGHDVWLASLNNQIRLVREMVAICTHHPDDNTHFAPDLDCSCGFYAVKESSKIQSGILAEVELRGTVIEAERGYRAAHQTIRSIWVVDDGVCRGRLLCDGKPSQLLVSLPKNPSSVALSGCTFTGSATINVVNVGSVSRDPITTICDSCAFGNPMAVSPERLSEHLGIAIAWSYQEKKE